MNNIQSFIRAYLNWRLWLGWVWRTIFWKNMGYLWYCITVCTDRSSYSGTK